MAEYKIPYGTKRPWPPLNEDPGRSAMNESILLKSLMQINQGQLEPHLFMVSELDDLIPGGQQSFEPCG